MRHAVDESPPSHIIYSIQVGIVVCFDVSAAVACSDVSAAVACSDVSAAVACSDVSAAVDTTTQTETVGCCILTCLAPLP